MSNGSDTEERVRAAIMEKDRALRRYLTAHDLGSSDGPTAWRNKHSALRHIPGLSRSPSA
jgi:hypothetical protein